MLKAARLRKYIKPIFLGVILLFMVFSFYPTVIEGLTAEEQKKKEETGEVGPVPLQMSQKQAGGPAAAYKAQQEADIKQNEINTLAAGR